MTFYPKVDIIVPNGGGRVVEDTIKGIFRYCDYPLDCLRIILIAQSHCGYTSFIEELPQEQRDIIFIENKFYNVPPPIPYNDGLEISSHKDPVSEYIHFLDDDLVPQDSSFGWIEKFICFLDEFKVDLAAGMASYVQEKKITKEDPYVPGVFGTGTMFFKRSLFERIGFLDEDIPWHCADNDYCVRARRVEGLTLAIHPESENWFKHIHQSATNIMDRNVHLVLKKMSFDIFNKKVEDIHKDIEKYKNLHPLPRKRDSYWIFKYGELNVDFSRI